MNRDNSMRPDTFAERRVDRTRNTLAALLLGGALLPALPALADSDAQNLAPPQMATCSSRYTQVQTPPMNVQGDAKRWVGDTLNGERGWGEHNLEPLASSQSGLDAPAMRAHFPEGSSAPSDTVKGGAGFLMPVPELRQVDRACLRYRVRFQPNFDFVKGGKLPGLYGGQGPSGGDEITGKNGFSMRFMWRKEGQGEVYEYVVDKDSEYGESVGRGRWHFTPGKWTTIEQEIVLNDPKQENGIVRVWIDGQPVLEQDGVIYRTTDRVRIDGLMFSTFFGGHGEGWRTPRDQYIDFADFSLMVPKA